MGGSRVRGCSDRDRAGREREARGTRRADRRPRGTRRRGMRSARKVPALRPRAPSGGVSGGTAPAAARRANRRGDSEPRRRMSGQQGQAAQGARARVARWRRCRLQPGSLGARPGGSDHAPAGEAGSKPRWRPNGCQGASAAAHPADPQTGRGEVGALGDLQADGGRSRGGIWGCRRASCAPGCTAAAASSSWQNGTPGKSAEGLSRL